MAKLTAKRRNALPKSKARSSQQVAQGNISPAEKALVLAKANRMLAGKGWKKYVNEIKKRGGARPGAGRKKGTQNKRTIAARELAARGAKRGLTPLEYMLRVMRSRSKNVSDERRDDMAKAAAPYMHPRLNAIQHTGKDGEPIKVSFTGLDAGVL